MGQEEWLELESDPGLFTLLVEDLGVTGVQVEEIYDFSKVPSDPVFGFIFLFRWQQNEKRHNSRRSSRGDRASLNASHNSSFGGGEPNHHHYHHPPANSTNPSDSSAPANSNGVPVSPSKPSATSPTSLVVKKEEAEDMRGEEDSERSRGSEAELFFAHQVVPNSCATHSLLSILMNTSHRGVDLGPLLREFRRATRPLGPALRGLAIGYMPPLMAAHNRHAPYSPSCPNPAPPPGTPSPASCDLETSVKVVRSAVEAAQRAAVTEDSTADGGGGENGCSGASLDSTSAVAAEAEAIISGVSAATATVVEAGDTYHFVCFLPVGRYLYELDGLKQEPINHGLLEDPITHAGWTKQCLEILKHRMQVQELRYNLMAVVPDRRVALASRLDNLEKNRSILLRTIQKLSSSNTSSSSATTTTTAAVKLEHQNGASEGEGYETASEGFDSETAGFLMSDPVVTSSETPLEPPETGADGRPLTRAASRAAAAAAARAKCVSSPLKQSPRGSFCIDLAEVGGEVGSTNNNALTTTAGKPYPTRSSTKRDTMASHSLASSRAGVLSSRGDDSSELAPTTAACLNAESLSQILAGIDAKSRACAAALAEEESKRQAYRVAAARRCHNYEPFIRAFLKELRDQGMLQKLVGQATMAAAAGNNSSSNNNNGSGGGSRQQVNKRRRRKKRKRIVVSTDTNSSSPVSLKAPSTTTAGGGLWSSSSCSCSTSSSTFSTNDETGMLGGGTLSRLAVKRARLAAVAGTKSRPVTRTSSAAASAVTSASQTRVVGRSRRRSALTANSSSSSAAAAAATARKVL